MPLGPHEVIGLLAFCPPVLCAPVYFAQALEPLLLRLSDTVHSAEPPLPVKSGGFALALDISVPGTITGPSRKASVAWPGCLLSQATSGSPRCARPSGWSAVQSKVVRRLCNSCFCADESLLYSSSLFGTAKERPLNGVAVFAVAAALVGVGVGVGVGVAWAGDGVAFGFAAVLVGAAALRGTSRAACGDWPAVVGLLAGLLVGDVVGVLVGEPDALFDDTGTGGITTGRKFNCAAWPSLAMSVLFLPGIDTAI